LLRFIPALLPLLPAATTTALMVALGHSCAAKGDAHRKQTGKERASQCVLELHRVLQRSDAIRERVSLHKHSKLAGAALMAASPLIFPYGHQTVLTLAATRWSAPFKPHGDQERRNNGDQDDDRDKSVPAHPRTIGL
jgi:hypothetical protein